MTTRPFARTGATRRDIITARFARNSAHVASLLVQAWPERIPALLPELNSLQGVEVHQSDPKGKIILTVEAPSDRRLLAAISEIESAQGVVTASLVYHEIEDADDE